MTKNSKKGFAFGQNINRGWKQRIFRFRN